LSSSSRNWSIGILSLPLERRRAGRGLLLEASAHRRQILVGQLAHAMIELHLLDRRQRLSLLAFPPAPRARLRLRRRDLGRTEQRRGHEERDQRDQHGAEHEDGNGDRRHRARLVPVEIVELARRAERAAPIASAPECRTRATVVVRHDAG
jgi:hypothetical protein